MIRFITIDLPGLLTKVLLHWFPHCDLVSETPDASVASPQSSRAGSQGDVVKCVSLIRWLPGNPSNTHGGCAGECLSGCSHTIGQDRVFVQTPHFHLVSRGKRGITVFPIVSYVQVLK